MALGWTQPLTEMSTRNVSWVVKADCALGWQPYHIHVPFACNLGASTSWNPQALHRDCDIFYYHMFLVPLFQLYVFWNRYILIFPRWHLGELWFKRSVGRVIPFFYILLTVHLNIFILILSNLMH